MTSEKELERIRSSATARKSETPEVGDYRFYRLRRDINQAANVRVAEAIHRTEPFEPEPIRRAKTFVDGLVTTALAYLASLPEDELGDALALRLCKAGLGATVSMQTEDLEALAQIFMLTVSDDPRREKAVADLRAAGEEATR